MFFNDLERRVPSFYCFFFLFIIILIGCGEPAPEVEPWPTGGACESSVELVEASHEPALHVLGPTTNAIRRFGEWAYIVESGANTVSRVSLDGERFEPGFIDVGNGRNPYDAVVDAREGRVLVANLIAGSLTVADAETGEVLREIVDPRLDSAASVAVLGEHVYVTSLDYEGYNTYGDGSVVVLDRTDYTVLGEIPTAAKNPQFLDVERIDGVERLIVSDTGALRFDERGAFPASDGAIELWTPGADPLAPERVVARIPHRAGSRVGAPGRPVRVPGTDTLYVASATAPVLLKLDASTGQWLRGADHPIVVYETDADALHHIAIDARGVIYLTAYNDDALYLFDTTCDTTFFEAGVDLGESPRLEGPHGLVVHEGGDGTAGDVELLYVMTQSNALGRARLRYEPNSTPPTPPGSQP